MLLNPARFDLDNYHNFQRTDEKNLLMRPHILCSKAMWMLLIAAMIFTSASQLWGQGQISESSLQMIEASRTEALLDQPMQPIFPSTPMTGPSSDFQPQLSSLTIQSVPEPSFFALGSLCVGLISARNIAQLRKSLKV